MSVSSVVTGSLGPDGPAAESIADLWWLLLAVGLVVFVAVVAVLGRALTRPPDDPVEGASPERSDALVRRFVIAGGVVVPLVVLVVIYAATVAVMRDVPTTAPEEALEIEVVGHMWWWEVRYPGEDVVTANELHLPIGRPVSLQLTSADVIHSFWVPALGGKMDLLPDGVNTLVLEATEPGVHRSICAEFCGLQHALMQVIVTVEEPDAFDAWVDARAEPAAEPAGATVSQGRELVLDRCAGCHAIEGTSAAGTDGPDLTHVASRPTLGAGAAPNTDDRLTDWIRDPHTIKPGVMMPATDLSEEQLDDVLAYLETLE